jgi:hypothetical protein
MNETAILKAVLMVIASARRRGGVIDCYGLNWVVGQQTTLGVGHPVLRCNKIECLRTALLQGIAKRMRATPHVRATDCIDQSTVVAMLKLDPSLSFAARCRDSHR